MTGSNVHVCITASLNGFRTVERKKNGRDGLKCACLCNCKPEWLQDGRAKKTAVTGSNVHVCVTASLNGFSAAEQKKTVLTGANVHGGVTASLNGTMAAEQKKIELKE